MVTHERSALQPGLYQRGGRDTQLRRWERVGWVGRGGRLYKCLANFNSKRTANTLSGTDSSHQTLFTSSRN